jgi:Dyp-type peroxidase family
VTPPRGRLQPGIHIAGTRPPPCWRLLLLDVVPRAAPAGVYRGLRRVLGMLGALADGHVRELEGQPADHARASVEQFAGLTLLVAFGRRLFDPAAHDPPLTAATRPSYLSYLPKDAFGGLPWAEPVSGRRPIGEADIALQLTAERQAGVNCAAVEAWKLIHDEGLPFAIRSPFSGFGRHDGRGWLEFHDGVSNLPSDQRLEALSAGADPPWMAGGTYMAFLRIRVDLAAWRALERPHQELIVGRDKLSGAGLIGTARDPSGSLVPVAAPVPDPRGDREAPRDWIDPPQTTDAVIEASHIHRANQSRASPGAPAGLRMFRQGYDFLEGIGPEGPSAGLNFVSFQRDLQALHHVLHLPGWLGDVSFGGPAAPGPREPAEPRLLALLAGGLYAVPPRAEPFPGAGLLAGLRPFG